VDRTTRNLGLTIGAFVVAAGAWMAVRIANPAPAKAVFETTQQKIGHVLAGEKAEVSFPIRNAGGKDLKILSVTGSCGCLNPKFPTLIRGGASGVIQTTFTPSPEWRGHVKKELLVLTSDPDQSEIKLFLEADIDALIAMDPTSPMQLQVHRGGTARQRMRITPIEGIQLKPGQPEVSGPNLKARLSPAGDGKSYLLDVTMGPCNESLDQVGKITLRTTSPKIPSTTVIVVALQLDGPVASPREVLFSSIESGKAEDEVTRLQVFSRSSRGFKLISARVTVPGLMADVVPDTPGRLYSIRLLRKGPLKSGRATGEVQIVTDDPEFPTVSVPVDITVR